MPDAPTKMGLNLVEKAMFKTQILAYPLILSILVQNPNLGLSFHPFHPGSKKAACSAASLFIPLNPLIHGLGYL